MKRIFIWSGVAIVLIFAGYGVYQAMRYFNFKNLQNQCYQKINNADNTITIYFDTNSDLTKLQLIAEDIRASQNIKAISLKSADEALQDFKQKHSADQQIINALGELGSNPLEPSITLTLTANQNMSDVSNYITQEAQKYGVSERSIIQPEKAFKEMMLQRIGGLSYDATSVLVLRAWCRDSHKGPAIF